MRSVRLSVKTVRELHTRLQGIRSAYIPSVGEMAKAEELMGVLQAALTPKRSVKAASSRRSERKATKREKTAAVRAKVDFRAHGKCEHCGHASFLPLELDHFRGGSNRNASNTVEGTWMLAHTCHIAKTNNVPSRLHWLQQFREHCLRHGYTKEARETERLIDFAGTKGAFGVAR